MSRILVTGVDGFTGRHLAPLLTASGHEIHGLVQRHAATPIPGVTALHAADLTDPEALAQAVASIQPQRVVHLAAIAFVGHLDMQAMYGVNLVGTRNLLEALARLEQAPQSVLLASSANVYGNTREGALDESLPPAPANDYAISKLAMEYVARLFASRLPLVVVRPFNYTGVGQSDSFLLPKIVAHVRRRAKTISLGNVDVARDFSDVRDVCGVYARLIDAPAAIGKTVNVCSGTAHTLRAVLDVAEAISGTTMAVQVDPALVRSNEVRVLRGDRTRLDALLPGLPTPTPLEQTLRWMIEAPGSA